MAELAQAEVIFQSSSSSNNDNNKTLTVLKALLNWLTFFFQVLVQLLRGTPSLFRFSDLRPHFLLSSSSSSPSFSPLPVVELSSLPPAHVTVDNDDNNKNNSDQPVGKFTIVLDLDETLVSAFESSSLPPIILNQAKEAGLICFELECLSSDKDCDGKPKVNHVTVFQRPGLQEFLKKISEFADLVLFTAGLEGYARPLVDRIDIENLFKLRLYRPSTISTYVWLCCIQSCTGEYREHVKDLSCLTNDFSRTVIVDNNPFSFLLQPLNGIPCVPFSAGQPYDEQLLEVLLPLLQHLSLQKDVRPILYDRFHMPEWFEKHGIPATNWTSFSNTSQGT